MNAELAVDAREVRLHGLHTHEELSGNLLVRGSADCEVGNTSLSGAQLSTGRALDARSHELEPGAFAPESRAELLEDRSRLLESFPRLSLALRAALDRAGGEQSAAIAQAGFPTPQGLKADGLRLQGIARVYESLGAQAGYPTPLGPKADGLRLQGIAKVYGQIRGGQAPESGSFSRSSGFDWADYAIGIGSGMGLILVLAGGLAIGWQRRHRVQTA
jgi:hypothetical protein